MNSDPPRQFTKEQIRERAKLRITDRLSTAQVERLGEPATKVDRKGNVRALKSKTSVNQREYLSHESPKTNKQRRENKRFERVKAAADKPVELTPSAKRRKARKKLELRKQGDALRQAAKQKDGAK
jgi:hypothetical protein